MSGAVGPTILDFFQTAGIPHASVCGGRGRCTTCRVQIARGLAEVDKPSELEAKALGRISASNDVRLACQVRPRRDITIVPLLPPTATARDGRLPGGVQGQEARSRSCSSICADPPSLAKIGCPTM